MPEKKTVERARKAKRQGKAPSTQAGEFVREEMEHIREGNLSEPLIVRLSVKPSHAPCPVLLRSPDQSDHECDDRKNEQNMDERSQCVSSKSQHP